MFFILGNTNPENVAAEDTANMCNNEVYETSESYTDQENEEPARKKRKLKPTGKSKRILTSFFIHRLIIA